MDLIVLEHEELPPMYSFLSLTYAFVADLDIESEKLRCLGGLRFDVYGVIRALCQK